jgi:hypothetical protein
LLVGCSGGHREFAESMRDAGSRATTPLPPAGGPEGMLIAEPVDDASDTVFDASRVKTYELTIAPDDLAKLDSDPAAEEYVPGQLSFEGETYDSISVRYKGSAGSFLAPCTAATIPGFGTGAKIGKCSIKLAFDQLDPNGRFHGLKKVNLHSMGRDPSLMREQLVYGMFRANDVASSRTAYARVVINGQLEGLFLAVEEIDGRFTRARFSEGGEGNLYKEIWPLYDDPKLYRAALESNKGDDTNVDKMLSFAHDVIQTPAMATDWIDRDYTLRYLAVDRVLMNDDGALHFYCGIPEGHNPGPFSNHNYFWYEERAAGRMWLIPWDLDGTLGDSPRVFIDVAWYAPSSCECHVAQGFPLRAPSCDPLVGQLAIWEPDYETAVDAFLAGPFASDAIDAKIATWTDQISPLVDEANGGGGAPTQDQWQSALTDFKQIVDGVRMNRGYPY